MEFLLYLTGVKPSRKKLTDESDSERGTESDTDSPLSDSSMEEVSAKKRKVQRPKTKAIDYGRVRSEYMTIATRCALYFF